MVNLLLCDSHGDGDPHSAAALYFTVLICHPYESNPVSKSTGYFFKHLRTISTLLYESIVDLLLRDSHCDGDPDSPSALEGDLQSVGGGGGVPRCQQQRPTRTRGTEPAIIHSVWFIWDKLKGIISKLGKH